MEMLFITDTFVKVKVPKRHASMVAETTLTCSVSLCERSRSTTGIMLCCKCAIAFATRSSVIPILDSKALCDSFHMLRTCSTISSVFKVSQSLHFTATMGTPDCIALTNSPMQKGLPKYSLVRIRITLCVWCATVSNSTSTLKRSSESRKIFNCNLC